MRSKNFLVGSSLLFALAIAGCSHVRPWERSQLAHHSMTSEQIGPAVEHAYAVQEGASGGAGTSAGGCGCN